MKDPNIDVREAAYIKLLEKKRVIVRVWIPATSQGMGHISLQTSNNYISLWPSGPVTYSDMGKILPHGFSPDYMTDYELEGRRKSEYTFCFYTLKEREIDEEFSRLKEKLSGWTLMPYGSATENAESSYSLVAKLLVAGGVSMLLTRAEESERNFEISLKSSAEMVLVLTKAKQVELAKYPITANIKKFPGEIFLLEPVMMRADEVNPGLFEETISPDVDLCEEKEKRKEDSFFAACAQELNEMFNTKEYTSRSLRFLCHEYVVELDSVCEANPRHVDNWVGHLFKTPLDYQQYLANIKFKVKDRELGEGLGDDKQAISGTPQLDGRIICKKLGIKLHVVECQRNVEVMNSSLVTQNGMENIEEGSVEWSDPKILHISSIDQYFVQYEKKDALIKQFLISATDNAWQASTENVFLMPARHAVKIRLDEHVKKTPRARINQFDKALQDIKFLPKMDICQYIDLSDNNLDDVDLFHLTTTEVFKNLNCLVLSNNQITGEGLKELLSLIREMNVPLKCLIVDRNYLALEEKELEMIDRFAKKLGIVYMDLSLNFTTLLLNSVLVQSAPQRFIQRRNSFWHLNRETSNAISLKSVISEREEIDRDFGVVAVVKSNNHVRVAIEYVDKFSQHVLILSDLVFWDKEPTIRVDFIPPSDYVKKGFVLEKLEKVPVQLITNTDKGLLSEIFKYQNAPNPESLFKIDSSGWVREVLSKIDINYSSEKCCVM